VPIARYDPPESSDPSSGLNLKVPQFTDVRDPQVAEHVEQDHFFWLDMTDPTEDDIAQLGKLFGFHPLALEDSLRFGQRPKLDDFNDHVLLVFYGVRPAASRDEQLSDRLHEVHIFISGTFVVTIHRGPIPELEEVKERIEGRVLRSEQYLCYRILDAITDTFFPALTALDDEIDEIQDSVISDPSEEQLERIYARKRDLVAVRRIVTPQRDIFARSIDQIAELPGLEADEREYFRDVYDHLIRISDLVDSYRDLLAGAMDVYLSTVANRQGEVGKQLAIIATIFLPLSFLTGFFGQNFSYMAVHVLAGPTRFYVLGLGSMVVSCVLLWVWFRRKGWFS
jgi:magnesium transporter